MSVNVFIVCSQRENYYNLLNGKQLSDGRFIIVDQAPWRDIEVTSFHDSGCLISILRNQDPFPDTPQDKFRTFTPDFVLLRSYALGNYEHDWRLKISGFYHADVPCLNSIDSFVWSVEKVTLFTKLKRVQKKYPDFPLIKQTYYSHPRAGTFPPDFPTVVKVGSSSQGVGKSKVVNQSQWTDTLSLLSMVPQYFTSENFVDWVYDVRVQKIGSHYRAIKRSRTGDRSAWKANEPVGITEDDVPVKDTWRRWIDAAAEELEMDICGLDIIGDDKENEYVLEINSSSIGFPQRHREEDVGHICELVISRLESLFVNPSASGEKQISVPQNEAPASMLSFLKKKKKDKKKK